jgi:hypothetical protein
MKPRNRGVWRSKTSETVGYTAYDRWELSCFLKHILVLARGQTDSSCVANQALQTYLATHWIELERQLSCGNDASIKIPRGGG